MLKINKPERLFLIPLFLFLVLFEVYPISRIVYTSFTNFDGKFTLQNFIDLFQYSQFWIAVRNSLGFAITITLIGAIGGTFVGYFAPKLPKRVRNLILSLNSIPNSLSGLVVAFAFIILLGRSGLINSLVQTLFDLPRSHYFDLYTWTGLAIVYAFFMIPLMTLTMAAVFENLDPSLLEAARNLGARPWQVWRYVVIPIMAPGLIAGISIQFAAMLGAFGTVLALVGASKPLLAINIYFQTTESTFNIARANTMALVLIVLIATGLITLRYLEGKFRK
jgi:putative spermidine/putrescine transport system permease protein